MVDLHVDGGELEVVIKGLHQLWAFKRRIRVPLHAVSSVRRMGAEGAEGASGLWKGWRMPGTHLPGVIVAGTYYKNGERHFWDVVREDRAIEIVVAAGGYDRLFVEVADPEEAVRRIESAHAAR